MDGPTFKSLLHRALISGDQRRVQDITKALALARSLAGPSNRRALEARNELIDCLRGMLKDEGIRNSPLALAKLARHSRTLREAE